ncbi:Splicing factor [Pyrenophora tritici-repentis]|nr:Splicing factor [Pyrenophora tritici-repentis]
MLLEDQRQLHEDLERLEDAAAERLLDDPPHIRDRLARDHDIARFLEQIESQSSRLLKIYEDEDGKREDEVRSLTHGDPMESFMQQIAEIRDFHNRYPNEPVENLEKVYKKRSPEDYIQSVAAIGSMFTGEEGFGRFFDLSTLHVQYSNIDVLRDKRRLSYLQFLDHFDIFTPPERQKKLKSEDYFRWLKAMQDYLENFMRRTKPLENLEKLFANFDKEFEELWAKDEVPGWEKDNAESATANGEAQGEGIWCAACKKGFSKETVFENHLMGKKHKKALQESQNGAQDIKQANGASADIHRFKERAVAEREFRIKKLVAAMQTERSDTKVNVERKQGMTERERQQELEQLYSEGLEDGAKDDDKDSDGEGTIANPLKLPLAWDGKPIPFWLYKLHGLGQELPCEICGNFVYKGRRAFDKHFNEPRHIHGLKCLGITNATLFREITSIEEAEALWRKIQKDKKKERALAENVVEMEDSEGNVMPEKVYRDLAAAGML